MKVIFGLGNPEDKYKNTRHNIGFEFLDFLKETLNYSEFENAPKLNSLVSKNADVLLVKPQTFMNLSGESVLSILNFYKLPPEDIVIIHDDIDIEFGNYKLSKDSSSAGHNGIKDIMEKLGTKNFTRVRIGVKNSLLKNPIDAASFVLQKFPPEEQEKLKTIFQNIKEEYF